MGNKNNCPICGKIGVGYSGLFYKSSCDNVVLICWLNGAYHIPDTYCPSGKSCQIPDLIDFYMEVKSTNGYIEGW